MQGSRIAFASVIVMVGCGDNIKIVPPDSIAYICGNGVLDPNEQCDDHDTMLDTVCDATCHFTCGNGVVDTSVGELCDTGIAAGAGACPDSCDDADPCTSDVLDSSACTANCVHAAITSTINGDGCCPTGANATTDSDCSAACGNGVLEPGELCDTAIASGAGACPTSCNDGLVCTTDTLVGAGTCQAACMHTAITMPANNDGCCPAGANSTNDNDCIAVCGNGIKEPSETCDTGITSGAGSCPTACSDGNACTTDTLGNPGTCQAVCVFPAITMPINNDGCCPTGANANNDNDCAPRCGNGVVEAGEQCDDGNMINTDACRNNCTLAPTAFRFSDLDLRDPHVFVNFLGCRDVTDTQLAGFSVNNSIQTSIQTDGNGDGFLDLSAVLVFRPLAQSAATGNVDVYFANCTAPLTGTSCAPGATAPISTTITNMAAGTCLAALPGTTHPYTPAITSTTAPCFVTSPVAAVTINVGGIPITLHDARIAGTYVGSPATSLANGLLMGFISEADANATIIPASFPLVGGQPLSQLLAGGSGACPSYSDKDVDNGVTGWWFYLNFPATAVTWTGP
jgi:cysteine-rich repeat protein